MIIKEDVGVELKDALDVGFPKAVEGDSADVME